MEKRNIELVDEPEEEHLVRKVSNDLRNTLTLDALVMFAVNTDYELFTECVARTVENYKSSRSRSTIIGGTLEMAQKIENGVISELNRMLADIAQTFKGAHNVPH